MSEKSTNGQERLEGLRHMVDLLDDQIAERLKLRFAYGAEIGSVKQELGLPVTVESREQEVIDRVSGFEVDGILPADCLEHIFRTIMLESRLMQAEQGNHKP
jgi:chorismate mutase